MNANEYMRKEAFDLPGISTLGVGKVTSSVMSMLPYLVTVPLLLGTGAGYLGSKMTSPSGTDVETLQREAVLTKIKSESGLRERSMLARQRLQELDDDLKTRKPKADRFFRV